MEISQPWRSGTQTRRGLRRVAVLAACLAAATSIAASAIEDAPPLLEGEIYALSGNGCGIVMPGAPGALLDLPAGPNSPARKVTTAQYIAEQVWKGDCSNGLAMGWGRFGPAGKDGVDSEFWPEQKFAYGRSLDVMRSQKDMTYILHDAGNKTRVVRMRGLEDADNYTPTWAREISDMFGGSSVTADNVNFRTNTTTCYADTQRFRGCSGEGYPVYGITRQDLGGEKKVTETWCPNPRSTNGCDVLWNQIAAETMVNAQSDIGTWRERTDAKIKQYADPAGPWLARQEQREAARRAEAERLVAEKAVVARAAEQAYRDSLNTLNAGQLFTLADELAAAGDANKAREVRRALVSRFPDSPLAATAAQQLAANSFAATGAGKPLAECRSAEDASSIPAQMAALPQDNLNLMTRGIIVAADFMVKTYEACLPDPQARQIVEQYTSTGADALRTCQKVSSVDNCRQSPFSAEAVAAREREAEASRQRAADAATAEQRARDARETEAAVNALVDTIKQYGESKNSGSGASSGGECAPDDYRMGLCSGD